MKTIIIALLTVSALNACVCSPVITSAFKSIETEVIKNNLSPLKKNLTTLNQSVEKNIKTAKDATPLIIKSNTAYIEKVIEAKKILFQLNKQIQEKIQEKK